MRGLGSHQPACAPDLQGEAPACEHDKAMWYGDTVSASCTRTTLGCFAAQCCGIVCDAVDAHLYQVALHDALCKARSVKITGHDRLICLLKAVVHSL